jgi:hypothetical protein
VDAITGDHLCLAFRQHGETGFHVTDEETPGWNSLLEELGNRFGVHHDAWFSKVAFPPFAENWTALWRAAQLGAAPDVARNSAGPRCWTSLHTGHAGELGSVGPTEYTVSV